MADPISFDDLVPTGTQAAPLNFDDLLPRQPPGVNFDDLLPPAAVGAPVVGAPSSSPQLPGEAKASGVGPSVNGGGAPSQPQLTAQPIPQPLEVTQQGQQGQPTVQPSTEQPSLLGQIADVVLAGPKAQMEASREFVGDVARGFNTLQAGIALLRGDTADVVRQREEARAYPPHPDVERGAKEFALTEGVADSIAVLARNPRFVSALLGEQIPNIGVTTAASLGGGGVGSAAGPVGTVAGLVGGAALGSGGTEYIHSMMDFLQEKGFGLDNEDQLNGALANPALMSEMREYAIKRGVSVGVIDGITSLIGAKGAGRMLVELGEKAFTKEGAKAAGELVGQRFAAETAINTAIEATGGVVGEAIAQYSTKGKVHIPDLVVEGLLEIPGSAPEAAYSTYIARKQFNADRPPTEEELNRAIAAGLESGGTAYQEAVEQGRTLFGFVRKDAPDNAPIPVFSSYEQAEAAIGPNDVATGTLFAVNPADAAMSAVDSTGMTQQLSVSKAVAERNAIETRQQNLFIGESAQNPLRLDVLKTQNGVPYSILTKDFPGQPIDLDVVQKKLTDAGYRLVPSLDVVNNFYGLHDSVAGRNLVNDTLQFATPEAKAAFDKIASNHIATQEEWRKAEAFLDSGAVTFKRLDSRLLTADMTGTNPVTGKPSHGGYRSYIRAIPSNPDAVTEIDFSKLYTEITEATEAAIVSLPPDTAGRYGIAITHGALRNKDGKGLRVFNPVPIPPRLVKTAKAIVKLFEEFSRRFPNAADLDLMFISEKPVDPTGIPPDVQRLIGDFQKDITSFGGIYSVRGERPIIGINISGLIPRAETNLYMDAVHEYGHHLSHTEFNAAPLEVRMKILSAYRRAMQGNGTAGRTIRAARRQISAGHITSLAKSHHNEFSISEHSEYFLNFTEWFAEQVARWGSTDRRPLGVISKFFRGLAKKVLIVLKRARALVGPGEQFTPEREMADWLNSLLTGRTLIHGDEHIVKTNTKEIAERKAQKAVYEEETMPVANILNSDAGSLLPKGRKKVVLHDLDEYNRFMKWGYSFRHLANANPQITELQAYRELIERAQLEANKIMAIADERVKRWKTLGGEMGGKLAKFMLEIQEMNYRTPQEVSRGVRRWPTQAEFMTLFHQYGLNGEAIRLYNDLKADFLAVIDRQEALQLDEANRIQDPALKAKAIAAALDMSKRLRSGPYFPYSRFGSWAVAERDANGKLVHFELFETERDQLKAFHNAVRALMNQGVSQGEAVKRITANKVPENVKQFMGVPPWLMDKLMTMPGLDIEQKKWMEQLRYQLAPATSWRKHLIQRKGLPGFSWDGRRVYAQYFFHHARQYARIKYERDTRAAIDALLNVKGGIKNARSRIGEFLEDHYNEFINPSKDFTLLRSITAIWHLGFMPVSAALNLTQSVIMTMPYLASHFGDHRAIAAMTKATTDLESYYKRGTIAKAAASSTATKKDEAMHLAVEEGLITESQAAELAAITTGSFNYSKSLFGDHVRTQWMWWSDKAMWMFQMAEQWNRRVTFRAAYDLAMNNPQVPWLQNLRQKHYLRYSELMQSGTWTDQEALAYLAGKEAILETHYAYDRTSRPRFMRGRKSLLFAFYMFTHNSLMTLWQNPGVLPRYMLITALLAGASGLVPDEVDDILRFIAYHAFGKDFSVDRHMRQIITDLMGEDPALPPDLILHGAGRYGFGIPKAMQMAGATWAPNFDMSRAITLNRVLPASPTALLRPGVDFERRVATAVKETSGAAYGIPYALYKVLTSSDLNMRDTKTWEEAMPRAFKSISRAFRVLGEGGEKNRQGQITTPFDADDPQHKAEVIGMMLGFTPTRLAQDQDKRGAEYEMNAFFEIRRQLLLDQAYRMRYLERDKDGYKEVLEDIKEYNKGIPDKQFRITMETLEKSRDRRLDAKRKMEHGQNPLVAPGVRSEINKLFPEAKVIETKTLRKQ